MLVNLLFVYFAVCLLDCVCACFGDGWVWIRCGLPFDLITLCNGGNTIVVYTWFWFCVVSVFCVGLIYCHVFFGLVV